jgi:hypothetical protein
LTKENDAAEALSGQLSLNDAGWAAVLDLQRP